MTVEVSFGRREILWFL